jgi:hypothetical protein
MAKLYACKVCGLKYKERKLAKMCEEYCKLHKSCNLDLAKRAQKI